MIEYLIKSTISCSILYLSYLLIFSKSRNYRLNRIILLFSVIFSLIVPLINISLNGLQEKKIAKNDYFNNAITGINVVTGKVVEGSIDLYNYINISNLFILIYSIIAVFLLGKFCLNLYSLIFQSIVLKKVLYQGKKINLVDKKVNPFSFFRTIYINESTFINGEIENDLILHETAHAKQLHSIDILFLELIQIFYWYNPFIYLFKRLIKVNHEFLADEFVIKSGSDKLEYSNKLINYTFQNKTLNLASGFDYSLIKNRLIMLSKYEQKRRFAYQLVLFVPIIAMLFVTTAFSSTKDANVVTKYSQKSGIFYADTLFWSGKDQEIYLKGKVIVKHGENNFKGNGSFSFLGEVHLLIINEKPVTLNYSIVLSGIKCEVVTLTKEEATKKYGSEGKFGAVEIKAIK
jgi:bla regulator protein blaR1